MSLGIREEALTLAAMSEHVANPIAFVVDRVLEVRLLEGGLGGMSLTETAAADPYAKTCDAIRARSRSAGRGSSTSHTGYLSVPARTAQASVVPCSPARPRILTCSAAGTTSPCSGTSGCRRGNEPAASARRHSGPVGTGPEPAAAGGSRSRLRTPTCGLPCLPEDGLHTGRHPLVCLS
jgi:hypothetical protein